MTTGGVENAEGIRLLELLDRLDRLFGEFLFASGK